MSPNTNKLSSYTPLSIDPASLDLVGLIAFLSRHIQHHVKRLLSPFELDTSTFETLAVLYRLGAPYEMSPTELRHAVVLTSGAMTSCIDRLEKRGWVERVQDPNDRRSIRVRLTPDGHAFTDDVIKARLKEGKAMVGRLTKTQQTQLTDLLRRLLETTDTTTAMENR